MEEYQINIKLYYKNKKKPKLMHFYPKNYVQLRDYFLSLFDQKSSGDYMFKTYPDKNEILELKDDANFKKIRKIKLLKNPAIFIMDIEEENEDEDYLEEIDKENLKFIEKNKELGFDLQNIYQNYDIKAIQEELNKKKNNLEILQKRIDLINKGINALKNFPKIDGNNGLEANQFQEEFDEINSELRKLK